MLGMSELKTRFGIRVRSFRRSCELTQEQLADAMGLTVESISNMERGVYGPKFDNLEKLALIFDVSVSELFQFDN
jgi:transcriptional regulator with XRE-family HTH domain